MGGFIPVGFRKINEFAANNGVEKVGALLVAGELEAFRLNPSGELFPIERAVWSGPIATDILSFGKVNGRHLGKYSPESGEVVLVRVPKKAPRPMGPVTNKGGRPTKYDWIAAAAFCAMFVVENEYPQHRRTLSDELERWFLTNCPSRPDRRDIERFVDTMYKSRPVKL
ncbi:MULTISPECIES: hypothetical protein [Mesorhizobium]|uniref:hypothetical protein n=1 Tax=Mesorhizobium TaxID=68287 RepID=UPI0010A97087|nr:MULTISPECIES: hypothetical protein [Mesorhizobium]